MPSLEERVSKVEDTLAIFNLIARHALAADTGSAKAAGDLFTSDGTFDRGAAFPSANGPAEIGAMVDCPDHRVAIEGGLAHLHGLPHVVVEGDRASATSYLQILTPDPIGPDQALANHGRSRGFRIHRVAANRWTFVRTEMGWRVATRVLRAIDGSEAARALLDAGLHA